MRISKERVTCNCGYVFDAERVMDAPIDVAIASMRAIRCPKCGSYEIGLGGGYDDAPPLTAPLADRAAWWRERGDIGTSSLTIWCVFTEGRTPHREFHWPLDPADFQRCKQLLDLMPEWRADLAKVTKKFAWFKPFSDRWANFEKLYAEESKQKIAPKLYEAMQVACREAEVLRYGKAD